MTSTKVVLDTGTSILGFPTTDLKEIIYAVKENRQLLYLEDINFYAVKWDSVEEFFDIKVNIGGHITRISSNDYMIKYNQYCIFFLFDLGNTINFILLGDSYLKGNVVIHDASQMRIGLLPQTLYYMPNDYLGSSISFIIIIAALISFIGLFAIASYIIYNKYCKEQAVHDGDYELMRA